MNMWKKVSSLAIATAMVFSMTACGGQSKGDEDKKEDKTEVKTESPEPEKEDVAEKNEVNYDATLDELKMGDYADLKGNVTFLTARTDLVDTVYEDYKAKFKELYPNITIKVEGLTDYEKDLNVRLTTDDWGTMCLIPTGINKNELSQYFSPLGALDKLSESYIMLQDKSYDNTVYGLPSAGNAQGIVYNKKVFEEAGVKDIPRTPDDFLAALQAIKDKTEAIPLYSNFSAGWTMTAWDAYIGGSATGDADFMNVKLPHMSNPFAKRDDMTGPYAVYYVLYEATARQLIEDDPTTTDWEACKGMINNGEIGAMVLGSWAISQMKAAGENPDDVCYMPFPITQPDGKQYISASPDYAYAVNVKSSKEDQLASKLFIKWLTEESNFAYDQGCIPVVQGAKYPDTLNAFEGMTLVVDNPPKAGEESLFNDVNTESEVGINSVPDPDSAILEAALTGSQTLDEIMDEWNQKWTAAQEALGVEVE